MIDDPHLRERWLDLCQRLGVTDGGDAWTSLTEHYLEPTRAYHNLDHIADCLRLFDQYRSLSQEPDALEMAIWLHDVIYDPQSGNNEADSAAYASRLLAGHRITPQVSSLILATQHTARPSTSGDALLITDIDLSILGAEATRYDAYSLAIRREYAHVPEDAYRKGRTAVLNHFLGLESIYHHPSIQEFLEQRARANLRREIQMLQD